MTKTERNPRRDLLALRQLVEATSRSTGTGFLRALVQNLPAALGVRYSFVGELVCPTQERSRVLAAWWNGEFRESFEYDLDGTPCQAVLAKGSLAYFPTGVAELFPEDTVLGQLDIQAYMGTPLRASDGTYLGLLVVMHDVPLDESLEPASILRIFADRAAAELQRIHDEQRWFAARERLLKGQKMEALGRLAGSIAHDFNNELAEVSGFVSLAEIETEPENVRKTLRDAHDSVGRAAALVRRLSAFAQERPPTLTFFEPSRRAMDSREMIARLIGRGVVLRCDVCAPCWCVHIDPVQYDQLLINLAVNARDAMSGQGELRITTECVFLDVERARSCGLLPGQYVLTAVCDDGVGMDEASLTRARELFFTTRSGQGRTGLGLATCDAIVSEASGALWIESTPGRGTTVTFALPRDEAGASLTPPQSLARDGSAAPS